ncbi:MAG TPA: hypothetical protein PL000_20690 [Anaerolineales bacterium]|nr:hypothetical protein [Anaerolineales bacterium]
MACFGNNGERIKRGDKKLVAQKKVPREKSIILTSMQADFVDATLAGKSPYEASKAAGYADPFTNQNQPFKSQAVQLALRTARDELSSAAQITRADIIDGFMEAINVARLAADPTAMIKGWSETAKVLGLYAPEVKRIEMNMNAQRLQSKFESMTDEDLIEIIQGRAKLAIEGEAERVEISE